MDFFPQRRGAFPVFCLMLSMGALLPVSPARADYTLKVNPSDDRGVWQGWGCSLCWWGNGVGNSAYQNQYADLFFTTKMVSFLDKSLPGLGMNIVRYNVGGVGRPGDVPATQEQIPEQEHPYKRIEGFWKNWQSQDPKSSSWDWSRDANQRAILSAAIKRGADHVEFFSNAPMWWMTDKKSSAGGALQAWNRRDLARYLATVTDHAVRVWKVPVTSVEPFNEPAAGWWNYPGGQEGCNIPADVQPQILAALREELDKRGLTKVPITASDENSINAARYVYKKLQETKVTVNGRAMTAADTFPKVNVHGYSGLAPYYDNASREALRREVGGKTLWMSEFGNGDGSGMVVARQITEDLNFLRPSAWVYWQPAEPSSGWGLVNGAFDVAMTAPDRAKPTWVYTTYYVMAQYTRFLRPGDRVIGSSDHNTVVGYNGKRKRLSLVTLNYGDAQTIRYDLSGLKKVGKTASVTVTNTGGKQMFAKSQIALSGREIAIAAEPNSVYSVSIEGVVLR